MSAMSEIAVCGVLVHAQPGKVRDVHSQLVTHDGVEVHNITDDGRLVVTIEADNPRTVGDTLLKLHNLDGVLSAAMVYQHCDRETNLEQETML